MEQLEKELDKRVQSWLQSNFDSDTKKEINDMLESGRFTELTDAFYRDLDFGTGGLRGVVGVGTNRMNRYTVGIATQGFANYLNKKYKGQPVKIAIAYDNRNSSKHLSNVCTDVLTANGIEVFIYEELRPTPVLSFAVRELGCQGGIMLTASHNPKEYNGYKVYGSDGGQLVYPADVEVIKEVREIATIDQVNFASNTDLITYLDHELDEIYFNKIKPFSIRADIDKAKEDLHIVFSPLHGTGITMVPEVLSRWGFKNVHVVPSQATPDGNFPTVEYPNPEEPEAFEQSLALANEVKADIAMATDPDCDRVGVAVRKADGNYELLNGNQLGSLLVHYVLQGLKDSGRLDETGFVVKTIVTTGLISDIARSFDIACYDVLTGFKYIGEKITQLENQNTFLVGGEESYGYLIGDLVRDKDAIISCVIVAEMAAWYKSQGLTLLDALSSLYEKYGHYREQLISVTKKGKEGLEEIAKLMDNLRQSPPTHLAGIRVAAIKDYEISQSFDLINGSKTAIELPKSNVLQFITEANDVVSVRPSGTEPKIKFYCSAKHISNNGTEEPSKILTLKIQSLLDDITNK
ncbi:phospho-sugar mutase [Sphingobacterium sp. IITKGP-BTPF85]|uniref:phospho-sugar mutase n=1 Tax=Sphingobacterium sp. IITKGP-BTPF85 TaxID=1338009 RepID=UPI0004259EF3|nr:phospho-sugar mutase [Sphingobacterium sp. IITKGP-BTPF85]KKX49789.1 phosphoglucomutase [Sphingobacterium sp. IITKGP-BTPF85]